MLGTMLPMISGLLDKSQILDKMPETSKEDADKGSDWLKLLGNVQRKSLRN